MCHEVGLLYRGDIENSVQLIIMFLPCLMALFDSIPLNLKVNTDVFCISAKLEELKENSRYILILSVNCVQKGSKNLTKSCHMWQDFPMTCRFHVDFDLITIMF